MANSFDPQIINPIIIEWVDENVTKKGNLPTSHETEAKTQPIVEYEGAMRVNGIDKINGPTYIVTVGLYSNQGELQRNKPKGVFVFYFDTEVADKVLKAAGHTVPYDEDDDSMLKLCGEFAQSLATVIKERLAAAGYGDNVFSAPHTYKNNVAKGLPFSNDQKEKQEISFHYLKHKALIIDWTLTSLPKK